MGNPALVSVLRQIKLTGGEYVVRAANVGDMTIKETSDASLPKTKVGGWTA